MLSFASLLGRGLRPFAFLTLAGLAACGDADSGAAAAPSTSTPLASGVAVDSEVLQAPPAAADRELRLSIVRPTGSGPVNLAVGRAGSGAPVVLHATQLPAEQAHWSCDLPGDLDSAELWAWGAGLGVARETLTLGDSGAVAEHELELDAGRWARVRAVDERGEPVAGAAPLPEPGRDSLRPIDPIAGPHPGEWFFEGRLSTRRIVGLADGQGRRAVFQVDLRETPHADLGDVVLSSNLALRGRLTAGGEPIALAPVVCQGLVRNRKVGRTQSLFTDEEGRFELSDVSNAFQWCVSLERAADPFRLGSWEVLLASGEQEFPLQARWVELEAWLRGGEQPMTHVTLTSELPSAETPSPSFNLRPHSPDPGGPLLGAAPRLAVHQEHAYRFTALVGDPEEFVAPWVGSLAGGDVPAVRRVSLEPNLSEELAELTVQVASDYPGEPLRVSLSVRRELQTYGNARVQTGESAAFGNLLPGDYSVSALVSGAKDAVVVPPRIEFRLEPGEQREQVVQVYQGLLPELDLSGALPAALPLGAELELELLRLEEDGEAIDYTEVVEFNPVGSAYSEGGHNMFEAIRLGALYRAKRRVPPGSWFLSLRHRVPDSTDVWSWEGELEWEPGGRPRLVPDLRLEAQPERER